MNNKPIKTDAELIQKAYPIYNGRIDGIPTTEPILETTNAVEAMPAIVDTSVLTTTKRKSSFLSPFGYKNKDLDIDTKLLKNTCLQDVVLTDNEIGLLKHRLQQVKNPQLFIKQNMPYYCEIRNLIIHHMPDFEEKYPRVYAKMLLLCFENKENRSSTIQTILNAILDDNVRELNRMENFTKLNDTSSRLDNYYKNITPIYSRLSKTLRAGRRNMKKKKFRKCKLTRKYRKKNILKTT